MKKILQKLLFYLELENKVRIKIKQIKDKISIEDRKPYHNSYLLTPRSFYLSEIYRYENLLIFIEKRILNLYEEIKNYKYQGDISSVDR